MKFDGHAETLEVKRDRLRVFHDDKGIPGKVLGHLAAPLIRRINEREAQTMPENTKETVEAVFTCPQDRS